MTESDQERVDQFKKNMECAFTETLAMYAAKVPASFILRFMYMQGVRDATECLWALTAKRNFSKETWESSVRCAAIGGHAVSCNCKDPEEAVAKIVSNVRAEADALGVLKPE